MTQFNPENKSQLTCAECLGPAMEITDIEDAKQYFSKYVAFTQKALDENPRDDDMTAEKICKINLGYYAGYYDSETRERVEKLFSTAHPIFGKIQEQGKPSAESALKAGLIYRLLNGV